MTINNIPNVRQGRGMARTVGKNARRRFAELSESMRALDSEESDVLDGAGMYLQSIEDDRQVLLHEAEQIATGRNRARGIISAEETPDLYSRDELIQLVTEDEQAFRDLAEEYGINPDFYDTWDDVVDRVVRAQHDWCFLEGYEDPNGSEFPPEPPAELEEADNDVDIYDEAELRRMSFDELLAIANWYSRYQEGRDLEGRFTQPQLVDYVLDAQHDWCVAHDGEDPNQDLYIDEAPPPRRGVPTWAHVHYWGRLQWLLAFVGLIIGLVIASNTWEPLFEGIEGFARGLLATIWWISLMGTGFFVGGWIGSLFDRDSD